MRCFFLLFLGFAACSEALEWVPPTAEQDPRLPQIRIKVGGVKRALHLQSFGDSQNERAFVIHGGPGADYRPLLPLRALSQRWYMIFWDQRGSGLSERVETSELSFEQSIEELDVLLERFSPQKPVWLIGHSWGGIYAVLYASTHPDRVAGIILIEPGPLSSEGWEELRRQQISVSLSDEWLNSYLWRATDYSLEDHAAIDYRMLQASSGSSPYFFCETSSNQVPRWRQGALVTMYTNTWWDKADLDLTVGLDNYKGPIQVLTGKCSALGPAFQTKFNIPLLQNGRKKPVELIEIENAGHYIVTDQSAKAIEAIDAFAKTAAGDK